MEECVKHGADASKIAYEALVNRYFPYHPPARGTLCILQDSFRRLVELGFNIQACDFCQVISPTWSGDNPFGPDMFRLAIRCRFRETTIPRLKECNTFGLSLAAPFTL